MKNCLESFYFDCRVKNLTSKTMQGYAERLQYFNRFIQAKGIPFEQVGKSIIQSYILSMKDKVSDYTINGRIRVLRLFFNYIRREGLWNNGNPMENVKLIRAEVRLPKIITIEEMEKLLTVPNRRTFPGYRNYVMLLMFWDTMIRLGEMLRLRILDVDLKAVMITVYGKGRKERCIPLGAKSVKALHHYLTKFRSRVPGDHLVCREDGVPCEPRMIQHIFKRIGKRMPQAGQS